MCRVVEKKVVFFSSYYHVNKVLFLMWVHLQFDCVISSIANSYAELACGPQVWITPYLKCASFLIK